jgi:hypothetical protein
LLNKNTTGVTSIMQQTFESRKAKRQVDSQPDKICWDEQLSFRDVAYRQLHHQNGIIGIFTIRLLEACDLKRSYWSPLALGPVKLLGLSKAHGAVTSYCTVALGYHPPPRPRYVVQTTRSPTPSSSGDGNNTGIDWNSSNTEKSIDGDFNDSKPSAAISVSAKSSLNVPIWDDCSETKSSPVVECNNNPVWDNCTFDLALRKGYGGAMDGICVHLNLRVDEEGTAVDNFVPGFIPLGGNNSQNRCLGYGQIDLTELLFGESLNDGTTLPSIRDEWVPITLLNTATGNGDNEPPLFDEQSIQYHKDDPLAPVPANYVDRGNKNNSSDLADAITGMVRVLISYQPNGYEPEKNDVVALETFARRDPMYSSCIPILPPLQPLTVLDKRGPYVLCEYSLPYKITSSRKENTGRKPPSSHVTDDNQPQQNLKLLKAQVRLHRNTLFVIERQNMLDAVHNLVLLPIDVALSTPLGQTAQIALAPIIAASSELLMPTILSLKLLWMATRATAMASASGVSALTGTLFREGANSLMNNKNVPQHQQSNSIGNNQQRRDAQFIQL